MAKLKNGNTALVEVTSQTARGLSKAETYGNGVETARTYDEPGAADRHRHDAEHGRRSRNNRPRLAQRADSAGEARRARGGAARPARAIKFSYDYLNRLTGATTHIGGSFEHASRDDLAFAYERRAT